MSLTTTQPLPSSLVFETTTPEYVFETLTPSPNGSFDEEMTVLDALLSMAKCRSGRQVHLSGLLRNIIDQTDRVLAAV